MADWGAKVSLPGKSISSTDPTDFVFNSKFGSVKIAQQPVNKAYGTATINASSSGTITIAHNLGFIPLFMVFTELNPGSGRWYNGASIVGGVDLTQNIFLNGISSGTKADSNNIYLVYQNTSVSNQTIKYYYYIFGDAGT